MLAFRTTGRVILITSAAALALALALTAAAPAAAQDGQSYDIDLMTHIEMGMPEQDVFLESADDPEMVVRADVEEAKAPENQDEPVYSSAQPQEHDPFELSENPLGPFEKGEALGFTLGEWLAGDGTGSYSVEGDSATLELSMTDLVPDGVYTVWCSRIKFPPNPEIEDYPCGAADGSENRFEASADGSASFELTMDPLEASTEDTSSVVALAYHSDDQTYGADPGEFGSATHVQLVWMLPAAEDAAAGDEAAAEEAEDTEPEALPQTGFPGSSALILLVLAGGLLLLVGFGLRRRTA